MTKFPTESFSDNLQIVGATATDFYLAGGSATPTTETIRGTVAAGNTVRETVTGSAVTGSPVTVTYTAIAGDTTATVARGLAKNLNANPALIAARMSASVSDSVVTTYWPASVTASVSATSTGSSTTSAGTGTAYGGSNGSIIAPVVASTPGVTVFTIGNSSSASNAWNISVQTYLMGPSRFRRVGFPGPRSTVAASRKSRYRASNGPASRGVQTYPDAVAARPSCLQTLPRTRGEPSPKGTSAMGLAAFTTPWPWTPTCTLTSPNGATYRSYSVSANELKIVNSPATGDQFSYQCQP